MANFNENAQKLHLYGTLGHFHIFTSDQADVNCRSMTETISLQNFQRDRILLTFGVNYNLKTMCCSTP